MLFIICLKMKLNRHRNGGKTNYSLLNLTTVTRPWKMEQIKDLPWMSWKIHKQTPQKKVWHQSAFSVIFSSRAQKEINESWNWYEERQPGLGDRFLKELRNRIY